MGAKPQTGGGLTYEQAVALGAKAAPSAPSGSALEDRSAGQVALDQLKNAAKGVAGAVTGIPGMVADTGAALYEAATQPMSLMSPSSKLLQLVKGAAVGVLNPVMDSAQGLAAYVAPNSIPAPSDSQWTQSAESAGGNLGSLFLGEAWQKGKPAVRGAAQQLAAKVKPAFEPVLKKPGIPGTPEVPVVAADINKWMGVGAREVEHGLNPGQQLMDEGLVGATKEATRLNVKKALVDAGTKMDAQFTAATKAGVTIDAQTPTYDAAAQASKRIGVSKEPAFQAKIDNIVDDIETKYPDLSKLTPQQAHALKVELGDSIDWHGEAYSEPINQVKVRIYRALNDAIKNGVPGVDALQTRWGNLYSAGKNLKRGMAKDVVGSGTGAARPQPTPEVADTPPVYGRSKAARLLEHAIKWGPAGLATGYGLYKATRD